MTVLIENYGLSPGSIQRLSDRGHQGLYPQIEYDHAPALPACIHQGLYETHHRLVRDLDLAVFLIQIKV